MDEMKRKQYPVGFKENKNNLKKKIVISGLQIRFNRHVLNFNLA